MRLIVDVDGLAFDVSDDDGLSYENTHHNCLDAARVRSNGADVSLTIDGANDDPSVCFDPAATAWVLRLDVDGVQTLLTPR